MKAALGFFVFALALQAANAQDRSPDNFMKKAMEEAAEAQSKITGESREQAMQRLKDARSLAPAYQNSQRNTALGPLGRKKTGINPKQVKAPSETKLKPIEVTPDEGVGASGASGQGGAK